MKTLKKSLLVGAMLIELSASIAQLATAEDAASKPLPKSGLLAVSSVSGASTSVTGDLFGGEDIFGDVKAPITGSISRRGEDAWRFSVSNNSQDRYSVNIDVVQKNDSLSKVAFASYSYTLSPGQTAGQDVRAALGAMRAELHLRSYRNLTTKPKPKE
jgi:hypothetical protein